MKKLLVLFAGVVALLCAAPARAGIVQSQSTTCATTVSCAVSLPSNTTSGNLLVFALQWGAQAGTIIACDGGSCSTTCPTSTDTWNAVPSNPVSDAGAGGNEVQVSYAIASGALTSFTFCVTGGGSHTFRQAIYEVSSGTGWPALASVLDVSNVNHNATTSTTGNGGNITPAATGEFIFSAIELGTGAVTAITISGTGMTEQQTSNGTAGTGWVSLGRADGCANTNSGNASTTCTFTWTTASVWAATIAAFKPAAAGGAAPSPLSLTGVGTAKVEQLNDVRRNDEDEVDSVAGTAAVAFRKGEGAERAAVSDGKRLFGVSDIHGEPSRADHAGIDQPDECNRGRHECGDIDADAAFGISLQRADGGASVPGDADAVHRGDGADDNVQCNRRNADRFLPGFAAGEFRHIRDLYFAAGERARFEYEVGPIDERGGRVQRLSRRFFRGPYAKLNTALVSGLSYSDTSVVAGKTYFYVVAAVDAAGNESVFSAEGTGKIPTP